MSGSILRSSVSDASDMLVRPEMAGEERQIEAPGQTGFIFDPDHCTFHAMYEIRL